jgi:hypothetical protein
MVTDDHSAIDVHTWPRDTLYRFDHADYDPSMDRLHLTYGAPCPASARLTPEGHVLRFSVADGRVCGLTLVGVRRRLAEEGRIEVTLGDVELAILTVADLAHVLTRAAQRGTRRFRRATGWVVDVSA